MFVGVLAKRFSHAGSIKIYTTFLFSKNKGGGGEIKSRIDLFKLVEIR